jgi:ABC-type uncharacterized transport system ATPase subunit
VSNRAASLALADPSIALEVRHLTVSFGPRRVIDDLSFTVVHGEALAIACPLGRDVQHVPFGRVRSKMGLRIAVWSEAVPTPRAKTVARSSRSAHE